ncbi:MAG: ABC transporter substrate-binding protein [Candidatus Aminicenantes bacterium]|nr:MAG: ABC transporter substrate-binding protein [Candidatus Aminicenantes bacterium]
MNSKIKFAVVLFVLLVVCSLEAQERTIKDDLGFAFGITSPPQRIISLAPNITETLFALGLGEKVIGVTRYCDFPEEAMKKEKIGGMVDPNLEKIIALKADLIIGFRGNPLPTIERLRNLNLPVFVLDAGTTIESTLAIVKKIGIVTHAEKRAESYVNSLRERYKKILAALRSVTEEPKVFLSLHGRGLWTCGKESFLDDLIKKARGVNIAGNIPRKWLNYNREHLIHEDPEVIIVLARSKQDFLKTKKWFKSEAHLEGTKAVEADRIYFMDENLATRQGPRLIEALEKMARLLHPQYFEMDQ